MPETCAHPRSCTPGPDRPSRVAFRTFGCRMNQAETATIAGSFIAAGCTVVPPDHDCDICVVHSCAVTAHAEASSIRYARWFKRRHPEVMVILAGCVATPGIVPATALHGIDHVVPQPDKFRIPELLGMASGQTDRAAPVFFTTRALLPVQDGCAFRCAYCIVPTTRGAPRSRPMPQLLAEARHLVHQGFKEIVITGTNVGTYRDEHHTLIDLLMVLDDLPGIERIRISSIELSTVEKPLIEWMSRSDHACRYIHLPLQSGDNRMLARMRRRYTVEQYRAIAETALSAIPGLGLGTDLITGFPGENEVAFQATCGLIDALPFSNLHVFPFSQRPGTVAGDLDNRVPQATIRDRTRHLIECGQTKRNTFAHQHVGQCLPVLIESVDTVPDTSEGWTDTYLPVKVHGKGLSRNQIVKTCIDQWDGNHLLGHP